MVKSVRKWKKVGDDAMFIGEFNHKLDTKGRIIIPAKFRELLGTKLVLTRGIDGCITVYTMEQWNEIYEKLKKLPTTKKEVRAYIHLIASKASECEFDSQGRILIPPALIKDANLTKNCVIVGSITHAEIWDEERWIAHYNAAAENFEEIAQSLEI